MCAPAVGPRHGHRLLVAFPTLVFCPACLQSAPRTAFRDQVQRVVGYAHVSAPRSPSVPEKEKVIDVVFDLFIVTHNQANYKSFCFSYDLDFWQIRRYNRYNLNTVPSNSNFEKARYIMGLNRRIQAILFSPEVKHSLERETHFPDVPVLQNFSFFLSPLIRGRGFFLRLRVRTCLAARANGSFLSSP